MFEKDMGTELLREQYNTLISDQKSTLEKLRDKKRLMNQQQQQQQLQKPVCIYLS